MPKVKDKDIDYLSTFEFHGVDVAKKTATQYSGECPFCGSSNFWLNNLSGLWDCKTCFQDGGNAFTFIRKLYEESQPIESELEQVAIERKIDINTLRRWGLTQSSIDKEWLLPAYGYKGEINNLYRWSMFKGKRRLLATPNLDTYLFGNQFWEKTRKDCVIHEGVWDAMAFDQQLRRAKNVACSWGTMVYKDTNILALPGAGNFKDEWIKNFKGKRCYLFGDSDHPKYQCGDCNKGYSIVLHTNCQKCGSSKRKQEDGSDRLILPPGLVGIRKVVKQLAQVTKEIKVIQWGEDWFNPEYSDGWDVRDFLNQGVV